MRVGLFPTCTVDLLEPAVGWAAVTVLQRLGHEVLVPNGSACCAQPAYNTGYWGEARTVAQSCAATLDDLVDRGAEWIVLPSGSCGAMIAHHWQSLLDSNNDRWRTLADRVIEMSLFLIHVIGVENVGAAYPAKAVFHPSCHGRRGLGIADEPLRLLKHVNGLELHPLPYEEDCCGFGGTFAVKLPAISVAMADEKLGHVEEAGARLLIVNDMGCGVHLKSRLQRQRKSIQTKHWIEVLAGEGDTSLHVRGGQR